MNPLERWVIIFVLLVLVVAWNTIAAQPIQVLAMFQCREGVCVTTEEEVQKLEEAFRWLSERARRCQSI